MRAQLLILSLFCLSSCGPQWISNTRPPEMLQSDISNCEVHAFEKFPPRLYTTQEYEYQDIGISSSKNSSIGQHHYGRYAPSGYATQQDKSKSIRVPMPKMVTKDANETARTHAFNRCMMSNGWTKSY